MIFGNLPGEFRRERTRVGARAYRGSSAMPFFSGKLAYLAKQTLIFVR